MQIADWKIHNINWLENQKQINASHRLQDMYSQFLYISI